MRESLKKGIKDSKIFLVLGTKNYVNDYMTNKSPEPVKEQVEYAKKLNKPFVVLLDKGVELPEGFLTGVKDCRIEKCDLDDMDNARDKVMKMINEIQDIKGISTDESH